MSGPLVYRKSDGLNNEPVSLTKPLPVIIAPESLLSTITAAAVSAAGTGFVPGDTQAISGGDYTTQGVLNITHTKVVSATVNAGGTGGTNGTQTVTGTTGTGTKFQASVTVAGNAITAVLSITVAGDYTVNPTDITQEPVTGASLSGAKLSVIMGALTATVNTAGLYREVPSNPASATAATGAGTGATFTLTTAAATGSAGTTTLGAGSAIIGQVGIDQTTPGTTDSVTVSTAQGAGAAIGATTGAKVVTDANGTVQQYLRGLVTFFANALGAGTAAAAHRVTLASDDPAVAVLSSAQGSTTSGQLGPLVQGATTLAGRSDTTAKTNPISLRLNGAVRTAFSEPVIKKSGALTITSTGYASGQNIGGLQTITGFTAGQTYYLRAANLIYGAGTMTTLGSVTMVAFDTNPTATTFTDAASNPVNSADEGNIFFTAGLTAVSATGSATVSPIVHTIAIGIQPKGFTADGSGQIYVAFYCLTAIVTVTGRVRYMIEFGQ